MRSPPLQQSPSSSNPAEAPLLGSRPYPNTPPQDADRQHARSHDVSDASHPSISEPPPPYAPVPGRCVILPGREARWRTKGKGGVLLSTLAATVLVSEGQLQGGDVELLQAANNADTSPTDPLSSIALSTYSTVHEILLGAAEGPREAYRQLLKAKEDAAAKEAQAYDYNALLPSAYDDDPVPYDDDHHLLHTPSAPPSVVSATTTTTTATSRVVFTPAATATIVSGTLKADSDAGATATMTTAKAEVNPYAAVATSTGMGVARIVGAGLKAPGVYTRGLARGFNNVPRLYGDETVREEEKIDGVTSGLAAAGKGLGYGLYDGITGFFLQPVKGAQKEGPVGFLKGFGKGLGGIVCKPAAGALGVPGYAFTGIQKSIERELSRQASPEECLAAAEILQGEDEMQRLSDKERMDIVTSWLAR
ncbi:hypothetical protein DIS24_g712 [Lasiodiplodia hormozganensis]|uniref:Uncharacterized protein n=1 Tax=Lasiodiplodia hormozganensis TaxID=869390 RepID=A0AA39Z6G7_9PEZI|nr:hypothetical protein DIS24_g712 [Lasiodiplodia hormozganensis]